MCDKRKTYYFYQKFTMQYDYFKMPSLLFEHPYVVEMLTTEAKVLYSLFLSRVFLSIRNKKMDRNGRIYIIYPINEVMQKLRISKPTAIKRMKELEERGLLERKRRGNTLPDLLYVKNIFLIMGEEGEAEKYAKEMREAENDSIENDSQEQDFSWKVRSTAFTSRGKNRLPHKRINTKEKEIVSKKEAPAAPSAPKRKSYNEIIDEFTQDEDLRAALKKYIRQRLVKKGFITNDGLRLLLKRLSTLASEVTEQCTIVENAIMGSYANFYPIRPDYSRNAECRKPKVNQFNQFKQRDYDYEALEKMLLGEADYDDETTYKLLCGEKISTGRLCI